tara:strand:- start:509 stop:904 length:396 start_codon:yes stop_codon:yes gene_type:complete
MRSKIAQRIIDSTPKDVQVFTDLYTDLIFRINDLIDAKGWSKKDLAEKMGKKPSDLSRMLGGKHNPTLKSIALLSAALEEELIYIPKSKTVVHSSSKSVVMTSYVNKPPTYSTQGYEAKQMNVENYQPLAS